MRFQSASEKLYYSNWQLRQRRSHFHKEKSVVKSNLDFCTVTVSFSELFVKQLLEYVVEEAIKGQRHSRIMLS